MGMNNEAEDMEVAAGKRAREADDWRSRTCGECGYLLNIHSFGLFCRRSTWSVCAIDSRQQYSGLGSVELASPSCPAFVAASIAAGKE